MLREENEGYSKLMIELSEHENFGNWNIDIVYQNILNMVSFFDLDPNRIVDIILEIYSEFPDKLGYINLLQNFSK